MREKKNVPVKRAGMHRKWTKSYAYPGSTVPPSSGPKYLQVGEGCQGRAEGGAGECQDSRPDPKPAVEGVGGYVRKRPLLSPHSRIQS